MGSVLLEGDAAIARWAGAQHRVVSLAQVQHAGFSRNAITHRVKQGRWQRMWRGVFLIGPGRPDSFSLAMAGVLTCDGDAALSEGWAGWLWGFGPAPRLPVDVTVTTGSRRGRQQVRVHRTRALDQRDVTRKKNIPVTTPARTLLDLAGRDDIERLVAEAQVVGAVHERQLHDVIARYPNRREAAYLRRVIDDGPMLTQYESERRLFALLRAAGLPRPETGATIGRYKPDFLYRDQKLIIEVDGFAAHGHRARFEYDRVRAADLAGMGYRVVPVTWRQLTEEPIAVAARIASALAV